MKKSIMIPIILSLVIAAGNISSTSVLAAESAVQTEEAILSKEGSEMQEEMPEAAGEEFGLTTEAGPDESVVKEEGTSDQESAQESEQESSKESAQESAQESSQESAQEAVQEEPPAAESEEDAAQTSEQAIEEVSVQEREEPVEIEEPGQEEESKEPAVAGSTSGKVAQAIWTEDNSTMYFYYGPQVLKGQSFKGNKVTCVWSGKDVTNAGTEYGHPKWTPGYEISIEYPEEWDEYPAAGFATSVVFDSSFKAVKLKNMNQWLAYFRFLRHLDIRGLDTSEVTTMSCMFQGCTELNNIKLTALDTSKVTHMYAMFHGCYDLKSANLSGLDLSKVTDMGYMFMDCTQLESVDLSGTDLSNVINLNGMFKGCSELTKPVLSWPAGSKVETMVEMFSGCCSLTCLDLSGFDTSNVTDMSYMFEECERLTCLDLSSFDTSNVTNMSYMFGYCRRLTCLDLSSFDTSNVKYMDYMFWACDRLKTIICRDSSTQWNVVDRDDLMFLGCTELVGRDGSAAVAYNEYMTRSDMCKAASLGGYFTPLASADIQLGKTSRGDMFNLANNVKVTWKAVPMAKYYKVYRSGVKDPVIVTSGLVGWDKEPGLVNGQKYTYTIVASTTGRDDPSGDSAVSYKKVMYRLKTVVIRSVKNTAPGAVTVKYDKTTSGDSYVLQYSVNQDMRNAQTRVVKGADTTSYTIGGLKKGKTYYISIRVRKKVDGIDYYTTFGVPKKITITR